MIKEVLTDTQTRMHHAIDHLTNEFKHLRTGRANVGILDGLTVEYYGVPTPINQVATLSVPEATLIVAQPYDKSMLAAIEKAIRNADLGLNPSNDGKVIRIPMPSPTEERRKELVKKAHELAEHCRTAIRQVRREANDKLKKAEKAHEISQDDERHALDEVQKLHDKFIGETNSLTEKKEKDIMEV